MRKQTASTLILVVLGMALLPSFAFAESLFRAGVTYRGTLETAAPRSLYSVPRANQVGDLITIKVAEVNNSSLINNTSLKKSETITENSTNFLNDIIYGLFDRRKVLPSLDGLDNSKEMGATAQTIRKVTYNDNITCQVVEVLPNGNLVIQGQKSVGTSNEQQSMYVSGIVNPFYLDSKNTIASNQVANLQMQLLSKGVVTRQQKEGHLGRLFRLVN